jgi:AraC family transcriptional regulator
MTTAEIRDLSIEWVFESPAVRIGHYRCLVDSPEPSQEKQQPWHAIGIPKAGAFLFQTEGRSSLIDAAHFHYLNAFTPYRTSHPFGCGDYGSSLVVRSDLLLAAVTRCNPAVEESPEAPFEFSSAPSSPRAYLLERLLLESLVRSTRPEPLEVEERALELVDEAVEAPYRVRRGVPNPRRKGTAQEHRGWVVGVKGVLASRFSDRLHLDEIAREVNVSPYHLCRIFKAGTGLSIHRYLNRVRLRVALDRVADPHANLMDVALDVGYSSHSHFSSAFRQEFGVSPTDFRRAIATSQQRKALLALTR